MKNDKEFLVEYTEFVDAVTSETSKDITLFTDRLYELEGQNCNITRLMTSTIGLSGEAGELSEIVKKVVFHGKPWTEETKLHLQKELGDCIWYWINGCIAAGIDPATVMQQNMDKLKARYPEGHFSTARSENRKKDDI